MKNIDEILREALQTEKKPSKQLNRKLVQNMTEKAEKTLEGSTRSRRSFAKIAVAALCGIVVLCGTPTAYATVKGIDIGSLFAKVWTFSGETEQSSNSRHQDNGSQENSAGKQDNKSLAALQKISNDVSVIKEKSTFRSLQIEPVMAVSDRFSLYVVLKVEGDKKLISENNTGFRVETFEEKEEESKVTAMESYLLSAEENVMYYAVAAVFDQEEKKGKEQYSLSVRDLVYADTVDEKGRIIKIKENKDGTEMIAEEGQYKVTFSCPVSDKKVTTKIEDGVEVTVTTLNAYFDSDVFEGRVNQKNWTRIKEAFLLMKDGSRVEIIPETGLVGGYTICALERPVDTEQMKGLEFHGKEYKIK